MTTLTVQTATAAIQAKTVDELFELAMSLEAQGNTELADKVLDYACQKQAVECYEDTVKERKQTPKPVLKPQPVADDSQAYQAWLEANAKPEPAKPAEPETEPVADDSLDYLDDVISELADVSMDDVDVELMVAEDYMHLTFYQMAELAKVFKVSVPPMVSRTELAQLLADAENGMLLPEPEPTVEAEPEPEYKPELSYQELKSAAKELGLKANGSYEAIEARIERHLSGTATPEDYPKAKKSSGSRKTAKAAKAAKTAKAGVTGLTYRQAQRFNSWCKANLAGVLPQGRNCGWNSVKLLMIGYIGSAHYKGVMANSKFKAELAAHLEVDVKDLFTLINATATLAN